MVSVCTDWIDQPAIVRHAELNPTTPQRPGLLAGPVLRTLMEQRHEILTSLDDDESIADPFHPHRRVLAADIAEAPSPVGFAWRGTSRIGAAVAVSPVGLAKARSSPVKSSTTSAASKTR